MVTHIVIGRPNINVGLITTLLRDESKSFKVLRVKEESSLLTKLSNVIDVATNKPADINLKDLLAGEIKRNMVECLTCNTVIESIFTNHRVSCTCGRCVIDGGTTKAIREKCTGKYKKLTKYYI